MTPLASPTPIGDSSKQTPATHGRRITINATGIAGTRIDSGPSNPITHDATTAATATPTARRPPFHRPATGASSTLGMNDIIPAPPRARLLLA